MAMAIQTRCICGRELTLRDELAGKVIRCPQCAQALPVPATMAEVVEIVEEAVATGPPPLPGPQQKAGGSPMAVDELEVVEVVEEVVEEAVSAGPPPLAKGPRQEGYTAPPSRGARERDKERESRERESRERESRDSKKKKKRKGSVYSETYAKAKPVGSIVFDEGWFGSGIVGGAAMMGLGLLIFVVLLVIGIISIWGFVFAAFLFIGGMLGILKGLMDLYDE
jgi:hypothetical protein